MESSLIIIYHLMQRNVKKIKGISLPNLHKRYGEETPVSLWQLDAVFNYRPSLMYDVQT